MSDCKHDDHCSCGCNCEHEEEADVITLTDEEGNNIDYMVVDGVGVQPRC